MCLGKTPFIALIGLLAASPLGAQTILERAARDEIATVADSDPAMAAAIRKARSTLADFLKLAATPRPGTDAFSLKVAVHEDERVEYFWITPFSNSGAQFSGEIDNTPRVVHSVEDGSKHYLRAIRHRRLALHREWDDEGQLHGLRAPQIGARKARQKSSRKPSDSIAIYEDGFAIPDGRGHYLARPFSAKVRSLACAAAVVTIWQKSSTASAMRRR